MQLHSQIQKVTDAIVARSKNNRSAYLQQIQQATQQPRALQHAGCANVAHAFAAMPSNDKLKIVAQQVPNIGIVTAYNDMLSAHAPFQNYPNLIKEEARQLGATAQVAGGVPAMCDGVTQGTPSMELSLFSRDIIAMSTAIALSHNMFDAAMLLGVCDKIVPGLLIGALQFGHLPIVLVPAGPMRSGLSNPEKAKVREQAAQGLVSRQTLLEAELAAYHAPGTCTFYGTANSNQMLMEAMGLHVPGAAFVTPDAPLREALTREAVRMVLANTQIANGTHSESQFRPLGRMVDERALVNAMVVLLATGGSTNHLIHWIAVARAAGITLNWSDFAALSKVTPLLARIYPNGSADVNHFHAAGGTAYVLGELLDAGLLHEDVLTVSAAGLRAYTKVPELRQNTLHWREVRQSLDNTIIRSIKDPFATTGGLKLLEGNLGRSVIKISAVPSANHVIEAPARVFDAQEDLLQAFQAGTLNCDVVCVLRWQGPHANGMPELHKLTPALAVLQERGFKVALVTDGRMSGASGKVPAAIHVSPEAADGGALARIQEGDIIRLDAQQGTLNVLVSAEQWATRQNAQMPDALKIAANSSMGRPLFAAFRRNVTTAEEGACTWL